MDLRRYAHLVALAEEGSFRRAAERTHLSQPAFSRSILAAEEELGMALFKRGGRKVACTPAGSFVVERIRTVLQASSNLDRDLAMFRDGLSGDVRLGMGPSSSGHLLPPLLAGLRTRYPDLRVRVRVQGPPELLAMLRAHELDFAVIDARYAADVGDLRVEPLALLEAGLFVRTGHPLLKQKTVRVADLAAYGLASGVLPPTVRSTVLRLMGLEQGGELPFAVECNDMSALKGVALATDAVMAGIVPDHEAAAGGLQPLVVSDLPAGIAEVQAAIVSLHGRPFSPVSVRTIEVLRALVTQRPAKRATSASRKRTAAR